MCSVMHWQLTHQADSRGRWLADRHYSRACPGSPLFMPPGRMLVLITEDATALWGSSWPRSDLLARDWCMTAWMNTIFRNEGETLSSDLVREAIAVTRHVWGEPPIDGMVTLIDVGKVRHKRDPGRCFRKAGFREYGYAKNGLLILQCLPADMPAAEAPIGAQLVMAGMA